MIEPHGVADYDSITQETMRFNSVESMEERLRGDGVAPAGSTPEELFDQMCKEIAMWRGVVKAAEIRIQ